ncbi:MAG: hypothetical protein DRN81_02155 [Thermoproteota archaeon]|nr:MAG: hypothetical protein DRN81_02155 [Candidatus Korarchaeota archaeon]
MIEKLETEIIGKLNSCDNADNGESLYTYTEVLKALNLAEEHFNQLFVEKFDLYIKQITQLKAENDDKKQVIDILNFNLDKRIDIRKQEHRAIRKKLEEFEDAIIGYVQMSPDLEKLCREDFRKHFAEWLKEAK